jgi:hypothetical protein
VHRLIGRYAAVALKLADTITDEIIIRAPPTVSDESL